MPSAEVAMLDFDELQEFPKNSSWATKSDFISDLMGTQNHQKTLYESWLQGCHFGKWTTIKNHHPAKSSSMAEWNGLY